MPAPTPTPLLESCVLRLEAGESIDAVARDARVHVRTLYRALANKKRYGEAATPSRFKKKAGRKKKKRDAPAEPAKPAVRWAADVVDNEALGRKKSKGAPPAPRPPPRRRRARADAPRDPVCCIYQQPRKYDESSSDEDEAEAGPEPDAPKNAYERMPRIKAVWLERRRAKRRMMVSSLCT